MPAHAAKNPHPSHSVSFTFLTCHPNLCSTSINVMQICHTNAIVINTVAPVRIPTIRITGHNVRAGIGA
jgi:hypothetical protein